MNEPILVLGYPGDGKSTSLRTLKPEETFIVNCVNKRLPFINSYKLDNACTGRTGNIANVKGVSDIMTIVRNVSRDRKEIKQIIIDDFSYIATSIYSAGRNDSNKWNKFNQIHFAVCDIMKLVELIRDDLKFIIMAHLGDDGTPVGDGGKLVMAMIGKFVRDKLRPEGMTSVVLVARVERTRKGVRYYNLTQGDSTLCARSPMEMFPYEVPNDMQLILDRIDEFDRGVMLKDSELDFSTEFITVK